MGYIYTVIPHWTFWQDELNGYPLTSTWSKSCRWCQNYISHVTSMSWELRKNIDPTVHTIMLRHLLNCNQTSLGWWQLSCETTQENTRQYTAANPTVFPQWTMIYRRYDTSSHIKASHNDTGLVLGYNRHITQGYTGCRILRCIQIEWMQIIYIVSTMGCNNVWMFQS